MNELTHPEPLATSEPSNDAIATLIRRQQAAGPDDPQAGLALIDICEPGLRRRARRLGLDPDACRSALWLRIHAHPLERRPHNLVANLILDACRDAARSERPHAGREVASGHLSLVRDLPEDPDPDPDPDGAQVVDAGLHLGIVSLDEAALLQVVHIHGHTSTSIARAMGLSPRQVQRRCQHAVARLRDHRHLLVAA